MKNKKKKKYYAGGPAKALGDMQRARKGYSVGSMLEGGTVKYKNGGPGDPPKQKATTGESIMNEGYKKIFESIGNKLNEGWSEFKKYAGSNANPTKPNKSVFRELYGQDKNKKTRSL